MQKLRSVKRYLAQEPSDSPTLVVNRRLAMKDVLPGCSFPANPRRLSPAYLETAYSKRGHLSTIISPQSGGRGSKEMKTWADLQKSHRPGPLAEPPGASQGAWTDLRGRVRVPLPDGAVVVVILKRPQAWPEPLRRVA